MDSKNNRNLMLIILALPLIVSTLSGLNHLFGFFSKISISTAIISVVLAVVVIVLFPTQLRNNWPKGNEPPKQSYLRIISVLIGVIIFALGVGTFLFKWQSALQAKSSGTELLDYNQYGAAQNRLTYATQSFEDIGLWKQAIDAKLYLTNAYVGIGDFSSAEELIEQLEKSGNLTDHQSGRLFLIKGIIAYERGEFEDAERAYQLARQSITPGTSAYAALLQNQAVLWSVKGVSFNNRVQENFDIAREIYQSLDDNIGLANILINEGALIENNSKTARAVFEEARTTIEEEQNPFLLGVINLNIGVTYRREGDLDEAEKLYNEARINFEAAADLVGQAEVELNLAVLEQVRGNIEVARQHLNSSQAYLRNVEQNNELIPPRKEAKIITFQADIYDIFGESEKSRNLYEEALSIYKNHPAPLSEATTLVNYAGLLARLNQGDEARELLERAREIVEGFADEGPNALTSVILNSLGRTYQDIGENEDALFYYEQSRDASLELGDRLQYAQIVENIGAIYSFTGDYAQAAENFEEALSIYREFENRDREAQALYNLYSINSELVDSSPSDMVSELLTILKEHNIDRDTEAGILFGILIQDIPDKVDLVIYRERLQQLRNFYEKLNEPIGLGRSYQKLANVEQYLGNFDEMTKLAREAEKYVNEIPLPLRITVHTDLAFFLLSDNPEDALAHFNKAFDLAENYEVSQQQLLALLINLYTIIYAQEIDCNSHLERAMIVARTTSDDLVRSYFQGIIDELNSICD